MFVAGKCISFNRRLLWTIAIIAMGIVYISVCFPGKVNNDGVDCITQALESRARHAWHSPFFVLFIKAIIFLFQNLGFLWMAQTAIFFIGVLLCVRHMKRIRFLWFIVFSLYPGTVFTFEWFAVDQFAAALVLIATGLCLHFLLRKPAFSSGALSVAACAVATACRPDYFIVVTPVIIALGVKCFMAHADRTPTMRRLLRGIAPGVSAALLVLVISRLSMIGIDGKPDKVNTLLVYDIIGSYANSTESFEPFTLGDRLINREYLDKSYLPYSSAPLFFKTETMISYSDKAIPHIWRSWMNAICANPWGYINHRFNFAFYVLADSIAGWRWTTAHPATAEGYCSILPVDERNPKFRELECYPSPRAITMAMIGDWFPEHFLKVGFFLVLCLVAGVATIIIAKCKNMPSYAISATILTATSLGTFSRAIILPSVGYRFMILIPICALILLGFFIDCLIECQCRRHA